MTGWGAHVHPKSTAGANSGIATNIIITRLSCPIQGAEYLYAIPNNTKYITVKDSELKSKIKLSFLENGTLGNDYTTVHLGNSWDKWDINLVGQTIYFNCNKPAITIEIECWV